jgi:tRNA(Ile)-lysidine synthase
MDLRSAFRAHLTSLGPPARRLLVAVSGGPDSLALLDLLAGCRVEFHLDLVVAHVNHGIHPDGSRIAETVHRVAGEYGLPFLRRDLDLGPHTTETRARAARYRALEDMRRESDADLIVTAHHADDQAETVLLRVLAGSGPAGLAAMAPCRGKIFRPLLPFRREELAGHVRNIGLPVWDDPANRDPRHLRSWLRTEVLPTLGRRVPDLEERLLRTADLAAANRRAWDAVLDLIPALDCRVEGGAISLAAAPLAAHPHLALQVVAAAARRMGHPLVAGRAERVLELLAGGASGASVPLGGGWFGELAFGRLRIGPAPAAAAEAPWELAGESGSGRWGPWRLTWRHGPAPARQERLGRTAWFTPGGLTVRAWREGERVRPLGGSGRRLVVRCLQDARVPVSLRGNWPALEHAGAIAWLPGVCRSDLLVPSPGAEALRIDAQLG